MSNISSSSTTVPIGQLTGARAAAIVGTGMLCSALTVGLPYVVFGLFAEEWVREFSISRSEVMAALMATSIVVGVLSPIGGKLLDTMPARIVIGTGIVSFIGSQFLLSLATQPWHLFAIYGTLIPVAIVLAGAIAAQVLAARLFQARRGLAIGFAACGASIGGILSPPLVASAIESFGWRISLQFIGSTGIFLVLPIVLLVIRNVQANHFDENETDEAEPKGEFKAKDILATRIFWILTTFFLAVFAIFTGFQANMVHFLAMHGMGTKMAGYMLSILPFSMLFGKLTCGYFADLAGPRLVLLCIGACCAMSFIALGSVQSSFSIGLAIGVFGFATGGMITVISTALSRRFKHSFGKAKGLMSFFMPVVSAGAVLVAWLQEQWGGYELVMMLIGGTMIILSIPLFFLRTDIPD